MGITDRDPEKVSDDLIIMVVEPQTEPRFGR